MEALIDLMRSSMMTSLTVMAPLLIVGLLVGMFTGIVQAVTNIQDPTISLVPRIMVMLMTLLVCLPWLIGRMVEFSERVFASMPISTGG